MQRACIRRRRWRVGTRLRRLCRLLLTSVLVPPSCRQRVRHELPRAATASDSGSRARGGGADERCVSIKRRQSAQRSRRPRRHPTPMGYNYTQALPPRRDAGRACCWSTSMRHLCLVGCSVHPGHGRRFAHRPAATPKPPCPAAASLLASLRAACTCFIQLSRQELRLSAATSSDACLLVPASHDVCTQPPPFLLVTPLAGSPLPTAAQRWQAGSCTRSDKGASL